MAGAVGRGGREFLGARQQGDDLGEMAHTVHGDAFDDGGLGGILGRQDQVGDAFLARADRDRKGPAHRTDGAVEREFAHQDMAVETAHHAHGAQDAERHRQVETAAFLADIGGREVNRNLFIGIA